MSSKQEVSEEVLLELPVSSLGEFFSVLPFDLDLGKLLALSISLGPNYVPSVVVLCCFLSQEDIFKKSHPLLAKTAKTHCEAITTSFRGRCKLSKNTFSDALGGILAVSGFLLASSQNQWLYMHGVARSRMRAVCTSITELTTRIMHVLPAAFKPPLTLLRSLASGKLRGQQLKQCEV